MSSKVEACAECTQSCLSLHRAKRDPYPVVCSFFKVMFGKEFCEKLIVPPRFARTLKSLEGKNTFLEDSTGQKWDMRLSKVKGSLVFQRGWNRFSLDHGIELGDFVVFHYIKESHFIVQIFTRSGCERPTLFPDKDYQNRRNKATRDSDAKGGSDGKSNTECLLKVSSDAQVGSTPNVNNVRKSVSLAEDCPIDGNTCKRLKVAPADDFLVESYFMTSRTTSFSREDDRDYLFDISAFEMPAEKVHTDETSIIRVDKCQEGCNQLEIAQMETASSDLEKCQISETSPLLVSNETCLLREAPILLLKNSSDIGMPSDNVMPQSVTTPIASEFPAAAKSEPPGATASMVKTEQPPCKNDRGSAMANNSRVSREFKSLFNRKNPGDNNEDLGNINLKVATNEGFLKKIVKPEPVDNCDSTPPIVIKITDSGEQDCEPFLELPVCLPIKICRQSAKKDQKLIMLLDPAGRRWPVIYQERNGVKILANGWKEFKKYNNIRPGDQCTFVLENMEECIFNVDILRC